MADSNSIGTPQQVSLAAVTANGNGTAVPLWRDAVQVSVNTFSTGSPTGATVTLDFSFDGGTTFFALSPALTLTPTTTLRQVGQVDIPSGATHVRAVLATLTAGTSPTVTANISFRARA